MLKYKVRVTIALVLMISAVTPIAPAETWHLEKGKDWKDVEGQGQNKYLLAVAEIKKLVDTGRCGDIRTAVGKLRKDFPEITGPDLDAFIEAEVPFCKGKFAKAARRYEKFLIQFPESGLYEAVLARQFAIANAFLAGEKKQVLKVFKIKG